MQNPIDLIKELEAKMAALVEKAERKAEAFALRKNADALVKVADMLRQQADEVEGQQ